MAKDDNKSKFNFFRNSKGESFFNVGQARGSIMSWVQDVYTSFNDTSAFASDPAQRGKFFNWYSSGTYKPGADEKEAKALKENLTRFFDGELYTMDIESSGNPLTDAKNAMMYEVSIGKVNPKDTKQEYVTRVINDLGEFHKAMENGINPGEILTMYVRQDMGAFKETADSLGKSVLGGKMQDMVEVGGKKMSVFEAVQSSTIGVDDYWESFLKVFGTREKGSGKRVLTHNAQFDMGFLNQYITNLVGTEAFDPDKGMYNEQTIDAIFNMVTNKNNSGLKNTSKEFQGLKAVSDAMSSVHPGFSLYTYAQNEYQKFLSDEARYKDVDFMDLKDEIVENYKNTSSRSKHKLYARSSSGTGWSAGGDRAAYESGISQLDKFKQEVISSVSFMDRQSGFGGMYSQAMENLQLLINSGANDLLEEGGKSNMGALFWDDSADIVRNVNILLQGHGYMPKNAHFHTGVGLDVISLAKTGKAANHTSALDVEFTMKTAAQERLEKMAIPLMTGQPLSKEIVRQLSVESRLAKMQQEKNVADNIFNKYINAIGSLKEGEARVSINMGIVEETQGFTRFNSASIADAINAGQAEDVDNYIKQAAAYIKKAHNGDPKMLSQVMAESMRLTYGDKYSTIVNEVNEMIRPIMDDVARHQATKEVMDDVSGVVAQEVKGSGDFKTKTIEEAMSILSEQRDDMNASFSKILRIKGSMFYRASKSTATPIVTAMAGHAWDNLKTAWTSFDQYTEDLEDYGRKLVDEGTLKEHQVDLKKRSSSILEMLYNKKQRFARGGLAVTAIGAMTWMAAASRANESMVRGAEDQEAQRNYEERYNFYLEGTGLSLEDGHDYYSDNPVLSGMDRLNFSTLSTLRMGTEDLELGETAFGRFKTMGRDEYDMSRSGGSFLGLSRLFGAFSGSAGYNEEMDHGKTVRRLNQEAQVMNHKFLDGDYNRIPFNHNLE